MWVPYAYLTMSIFTGETAEISQETHVVEYSSTLHPLFTDCPRNRTDCP